MADRKVRSVTFKLPFNMTPKELKEAIDGCIESNVTVFQDLGNGEYLIEVSNQRDAEALVDEGFDFEDTHVSCHPPHGKLTNVSILNLRSYIEDDEVKKVLNQYGEVKGDVIRLKYKGDHAFAGLENGNRLVKMVLEKRSIPYSLRIGGEWCRVIHNDQQPVCSECKELGHTRKRCPEIICRICKEKGHMSYNCDRRNNRDEVEQQMGDQNETSTNSENTAPAENVPVPTTTNDAGNVNSNEEIGENNISGESSNDISDQGNLEEMEIEKRAQGCKRQLAVDSSDSDSKAPPRRQRLNPAPNVKNSGKQRDKSTTGKTTT